MNGPVLAFACPAWVNRVAQDRNGDWWGYSVEPLRNDSGWYENECGQCICLGRTDHAGWEPSLRRF